jgi:hypothetical protein
METSSVQHSDSFRSRCCVLCATELISGLASRTLARDGSSWATFDMNTGYQMESSSVQHSDSFRSRCCVLCATELISGLPSSPTDTGGDCATGCFVLRPVTRAKSLSPATCRTEAVRYKSKVVRTRTGSGGTERCSVPCFYYPVTLLCSRVYMFMPNSESHETGSSQDGEPQEQWLDVYCTV